MSEHDDRETMRRDFERRIYAENYSADEPSTEQVDVPTVNQHLSGKGAEPAPAAGSDVAEPTEPNNEARQLIAAKQVLIADDSATMMCADCDHGIRGGEPCGNCVAGELSLADGIKHRLASIRKEHDADRQLFEHMKLRTITPDAERYNMLFRDTWRDGQGIAIFRYTRPHDDFERLGIAEANELLDAVRKREEAK